MSKMEMLSTRDDRHGALQIKLRGSLDIFSYLELKRLLEDQVNKEAPEKVLVDLTEVSYIASSGWAVLTNAAKQLRRAGGMLAIFGMSEDVNKIYETMGIAPLLKSAENHALALDLIETK